jgi:xanthine dehydrogenase YagS FAD-binding subunit
MRAFTYTTATDAPHAVATVASSPGSVFLGGGTNLVDLMRLGVQRPEGLVDVSRLPGLAGTEPTASGGLLIGAAVRNSDLAADSRVRDGYPVLAEALLSGASGQLRNMATVGGNLLQRTRCTYFQDVSKPCNKRDPGSGCPAREGVHRDLAVLGASEHCVATHPSDMSVALAALDAVVHVTGPDGNRAVTLDDFYRLPGDDPSRDTTLGHGDLVTAVELPAAGTLLGHSAYRKARDRASYAFAVGSVAAALEVSAGTVTDVRLAFGAVAPRPWRARTAEDALRGRPTSAEEFAAAVDAELVAAEPLRDNRFKVDLIRRLAVATLTRLAAADTPEGAGR